MWHRIIQGGVISMALAFAGDAVAGNAECVWSNLSPATRDALQAAYDREGLDGPDTVAIPPVDKQRIIGRCVASGGNINAAGKVISLIIVRDDLERQLRALHIHEVHVHSAWRSLSPSERFAIREMIRQTSDESKRAGNAVAAKVFANARVQDGVRVSQKPAEASKLLLFYLGTLAVIEGQEALF